jgi:hypothetical protein
MTTKAPTPQHASQTTQNSVKRKRERERERARETRAQTIDEQVLREMESVKVLTSLGPVESAQGGTRASTGLESRRC